MIEGCWSIGVFWGHTARTLRAEEGRGVSMHGSAFAEPLHDGDDGRNGHDRDDECDCYLGEREPAFFERQDEGRGQMGPHGQILAVRERWGQIATAGFRRDARFASGEVLASQGRWRSVGVTAVR
jgi:hypothetical protein